MDDIGSISIQMEMRDGNVEVETATPFGKYDEKTPGSSSKSQSTQFTFGSNTREDIPIDQLHERHYIYRKGSTKVHVHTYDASSANDVINNTVKNKFFLKGIKLISAIIAVIIIIITLVVKLTAAITSKISPLAEDVYLLVLYSVGLLWTTYCNFKWRCIKQDQFEFSKYNKSSNRWLKGVIVLFGMAIVLNDGLAFIAKLMVDITHCIEVQVSDAVSFIHGLFIMSQVKYLFRFAKVFIRNCSIRSSTGLMFLIATNLSFWIASVVDETLKALSPGSSHHPYDKAVPSTNITSSYQSSNQTLSPTNHHQDVEDSCNCHSSFCSTVHVSETFLHPFGIEFSLVASCLLYVIWGNIGKQPHPCEGVVIPSYKFHKQYTGIAFGGLAVFFTVAFMILLGTSASDVSLPDKTYYTEYPQLVLYNVYLIVMDSSMLIATLIGFFYFYRVRRPLEESSMLDGVLLAVCVIGPVVLHTFSVVALIVEPANEMYAWGLSLVRPLIEVFQCIIQMVFVMYGLKREPSTSTTSKEAIKQLRHKISEQVKYNFPKPKEPCKIPFDNKTFLRSHRNSITSVVSKLAHGSTTQGTELSEQYMRVERASQTYDARVEENLPPVFSEVVVSELPEVDGNVENKQSFSPLSVATQSVVSVDAFPDKSYINKERTKNHSILKVVSETKVSRPDLDRTRLRDTMMFLIVTNACLWMFLSLSGTAYTVYQYESVFFGTSGWTIITMMCRPLNLFFRMHSAGCLFEMWSFA